MDSGTGAGLVEEIDIGHGFARIYTDKAGRLFRISAAGGILPRAEESRFLALLGMTRAKQWDKASAADASS